MRVEDAEGDWHDIDTTLVADDGVLRPRFAASDLQLSDGGDRTFAALSEDGKDLSWKWEAALPAPEVDGDTATYRNVVPGGDLLVKATETGFSHSIVLRERPTDPDLIQFSIPVATDGVRVTETPAGGIEFKAAGEVVAAAPQPVMWDAATTSAGDPTNVAEVDTTITQRGGTTPEGEVAATSPVLTLSPDEGFLSDPDTQYPVTIDPSYTTSWANGDTWIQNAASSLTTSQGDSDELRVGTYDGGAHIARSFLQFSSTPFVGKYIVDADLRARNWYANSCSAAEINAVRITEPWYVTAYQNPGHPAISWGDQPNWTNTGKGVFTPAYGASGCPANGAAWNVTTIVRGWADGTFPNHGIRLHATSENANASWRRYRSINYTDTAVEPRLVVTYTQNPATPQVGVSPCPECDPSYLFTDTLTPMLTAKSTDPDSATLTFTWKVREEDSGLQVYVGTSTAAQGATTSHPLPAGLLQDEVGYEVQVTASDGYGQTASPWTFVGVDVKAPPSTPTELQISPCASPCDTLVSTSLMPVLSGIVDDPDTGVMSGAFEVRHTGQTALLASGNTEATAAGERAVFAVPPNVLTAGGSYEFRVGSENSGETAWSPWTPFTVAIPTGPTEPIALTMTDCASPCEEWQSNTSTPTFRASRPLSNVPVADVQFEVRSLTGSTAGAVSAAPLGTADWTVPPGLLGADAYDVRAGISMGGETTWTAWHPFRVLPDATVPEYPTIDTGQITAETELGDGPDPLLNAEDVGPAGQYSDADLADLDARIDADVNLASSMRVSADAEAPEAEAYVAARDVDPWIKYTPIMYFEPYEKHFPLSATTFVNNSRLRWSHDLCQDDDISDDPRADKLGSGLYSHQSLFAPCFNHTGHRWLSTEPVKPGGPGGPTNQDGMFLDMANGLRDGGGGSDPLLKGDEPVYVIYVPYQKDVKPGRIEYFFNYGDSFVLGPQGVVTGHHEGDWEHIAIKLRKSNNTPEKVQYFYHHDSCTLLWDAVTKKNTHPQIWVGRNSHGSYPARSYAQTVYWHGIPHTDDIASSSKIWYGSANPKLAKSQSWWGYAGGWGEKAGSAVTGGTHGPWGPNPYRKVPGFGTPRCHMWSDPD